jgi:hypothetical protein
MPISPSGPFNIEQGNSANFTVEFFDINGLLAIPVGPSMTISYINISNINQIDTITLTPSNNFFTGTWSSASAALGLANYSTVAASVQVATGQIRVIQRKASS